MTLHFDSPEEAADTVVEAVGPRIVLGLPVGLGKAVHLANALYERARDDPSVDLTIFTALTLEAPEGGSGLEERFLGPLRERLFGDWPRQAYAEDLRRRVLPSNVRVREFYFRPAAWLGNPLAQQSYTSLNYSQVTAELLDLGVNVIGQLVAARPESPDAYSLSSNPEITLDLLDHLDARGDSFVMAGQVNRELPYMTGEAELEKARFDVVLDSPACRFPLFGLPNPSVSDADYATGMHVASLVPDGGTLQLGIGSLSDAVAHCLRLRHRAPDVFRRVLGRLPGGPGSGRRPDLPLETDPFREGLFVSTELLSDAVFSLFESGLVHRGADPDDDALMHAGFFIGSRALYRGLRELPEERRGRIAMSRISWVNTLYGDEVRKRRQRRDARFVNEAMMVTLLGAAVSDGLEDGGVVSGVGGQFDFVSMAHALEDARSILMLNSRRSDEGSPRSNVRWSYGHTTVPRHYRDVFATEYGLAATRGQPDGRVIASLLSIADSAFQQGLLAEARSAGKIQRSYDLPASSRGNTPDALAAVFRRPDVAEHFPEHPMGTDLTSVERRLAPALKWLEQRTARPWSRLRVLGAALLGSPGPEHEEALARMGLDSPRGLREAALRRLVSLALDRASS